MSSVRTNLNRAEDREDRPKQQRRDQPRKSNGLAIALAIAVPVVMFFAFWVVAGIVAVRYMNSRGDSSPRVSDATPIASPSTPVGPSVPAASPGTRGSVPPKPRFPRIEITQRAESLGVKFRDWKPSGSLGGIEGIATPTIEPLHSVSRYRGKDMIAYIYDQNNIKVASSSLHLPNVTNVGESCKVKIIYYGDYDDIGKIVIDVK